MKRLMMLLVLPLLSSCTIEDDYYRDDYHHRQPRAQVEVPSYHSSNQYRHHRDAGSGNSHGKKTYSQDYTDNSGNHNHGHD